MGLLDDAIKDHLDLKRRRGADPTEVSREEHDALGPVRRDPVHHSDAEAEAVEALPPPPAEELVSPESPSAVEVGEVPGEEATQILREPLQPDDHSHTPPAGDELLDPDPAPAAAEAEVEAPPAEAAPPPDHTAEFSVEEHLAREEAATDDAPPAEPEAADPEPAEEHSAAEAIPDDKDGEDVLEETPEFLQETPEHDRLWFEQRPPRDFDFGN